ncbi:SDR family NAD(P)-dependent oxidoreductase [Nocardia rhamnosiphila]|uniref:SDR family NAD(P)-dependent oxidoreductase n=1 Tax=Nocardia rhamnosiphila TaxID=426716 RepID=UPI0004C2FA58|nr:SDR family NAD(P)-dependent oxidoreductase [Nocardia rhamnosiphila]
MSEKIVVVTGATRGIGRATATAFARAGYRVIVTGRRAPAVEAVVAELRSAGLAAEGEILDVCSVDSARCLRDSLAERRDHIDVLVNNAGILPEATATGTVNFAHPGAFTETLMTNTFGPVNVIEALLPLVRRAPAGRIVNISTEMGSLTEQRNPESAYYSMVVPGYQASKAALNSITVGLAKSLADTAVRVTSVCPGFVATELAPAAADAPTTPEQAAQVVLAAAESPEVSTDGSFVGVQGAIAW